MEDIMDDNFEKLNLLLEQELCEFVDIPDGFFTTEELVNALCQ